MVLCVLWLFIIVLRTNANYQKQPLAFCKLKALANSMMQLQQQQLKHESMVLIAKENMYYFRVQFSNKENPSS